MKMLQVQNYFLWLLINFFLLIDELKKAFTYVDFYTALAWPEKVLSQALWESGCSVLMQQKRKL